MDSRIILPATLYTDQHFPSQFPPLLFLEINQEYRIFSIEWYAVIIGTDNPYGQITTIRKGENEILPRDEDLIAEAKQQIILYLKRYIFEQKEKSNATAGMRYFPIEEPKLIKVEKGSINVTLYSTPGYESLLNKLRYNRGMSKGMKIMFDEILRTIIILNGERTIQNLEF